jgi:molybdopterin-guanine dinucleotide biosynthesis protein A
VSPDQNIRVLGIVLAGGGARRMGGVDKTALDVGGTAIADRVAHALATTCQRTIVVGAETGGGPAAAVASAASAMRDADIVVVVAGDLALLRADHVEALVTAMAGGEAAAAAIDDRGRPNPLVAAYRASTLRATIAAIGEGDRADRLLPPDTRAVQLDGDATFSVNTPADLEEARGRFSR